MESGVTAMKKVICIILTTVMCLSLCGCVNVINYLPFAKYRPVSAWEQRNILKYLENKYGEEFVIESTHASSDSASSSRWVNVHPMEKENDSFSVRIMRTGEFTDDYDVMLHSKRLFPIYDEWIRGVFPYAKVAVQLSGRPKREIKYYDPQQPIQEFIDEAQRLSIEVNIMFSETMLEQKDDIFKEACTLPETEPLKGYQFIDYRIGFMKEEAFKSVKAGEYRRIPISLKPIAENDESDEGFIAITGFGIIENYPLPAYLDQLYNNFDIKEETE